MISSNDDEVKAEENEQEIEIIRTDSQSIINVSATDRISKLIQNILILVAFGQIKADQSMQQSRKEEEYYLWSLLFGIESQSLRLAVMIMIVIDSNK